MLPKILVFKKWIQKKGKGKAKALLKIYFIAAKFQPKFPLFQKFDLGWGAYLRIWDITPILLKFVNPQITIKRNQYSISFEDVIKNIAAKNKYFVECYKPRKRDFEILWNSTITFEKYTHDRESVSSRGISW